MFDIDLNDITPKDAKITIGEGEHAKTVRFRKINLGDESWLKETFGKEFNFSDKMTDEQLCRIAFHQLEYEDKKKFAPTEVKFINDDTGEEAVHKVGGWRLFQLNLSGLQDKIKLLKAILYTAGVSRPMLDKILTDEEKKQIGLESTEPESKKKRSTGRKSSTY